MADTASNEPHSGIVAITGGYLSQNMGSAAMTIVASEMFRTHGFSIEVFSKYPHDDATIAAIYTIPLRRASQAKYTLLALPILGIAALVPPVVRYIRRRWYRDIVAFYDIGGITFSSHRDLVGFLINLTWLSIPLLLGIPVIKGSQALGPFNRWYLTASLPLLRRAALVFARGHRTAQYLQEARVPYEYCPDIAFLLKATPSPPPFDTYITIAPSSVVLGLYDRRFGTGSYLTLLETLVRELVDKGHRICLLAHCYRSGTTLNNNDAPIVREIHKRAQSQYVHAYDVSGRTPAQLKYVLGKSEVVITSRFHAMIASLSMDTPAIVLGWSQKYDEVLQQFGLSQFAIRWDQGYSAEILAAITYALEHREQLVRQISDQRRIIESRVEDTFRKTARLIRTRRCTW